MTNIPKYGRIFKIPLSTGQTALGFVNFLDQCGSLFCCVLDAVLEENDDIYYYINHDIAIHDLIIGGLHFSRSKHFQDAKWEKTKYFVTDVPDLVQSRFIYGSDDDLYTGDIKDTSPRSINSRQEFIGDEHSRNIRRFSIRDPSYYTMYIEAVLLGKNIEWDEKAPKYYFGASADRKTFTCPHGEPGIVPERWPQVFDRFL